MAKRRLGVEYNAPPQSPGEAFGCYISLHSARSASMLAWSVDLAEKLKDRTDLKDVCTQGRWGRGAPDSFESVGVFGRF
jgi:hypothetical protein